VKLNITWIN